MEKMSSKMDPLNLDIFDLKIGFKCNNNCLHCVVADKRPTRDLTLEEIKSILSKVPSGTMVQITGGEPTFYKEKLFEILKYCYKKNLIAVIQSNATGFDDEAFCKKCAPYISNVHVALHSCYPEVHNDIVGCKDNTMWQRTVNGIDNLFKNKIHITSQTVLSKKNIKTIPETFDFIQERWPETFMSLTYPHLMGNAWHNRDEVAFRYSDYKDIFQKVFKKYHNTIFTESIPPCYRYPYLGIDNLEADLLTGMTGPKRLGIDLSTGKDYNNYNFLDLRDRRKAPKCKECVFNDNCVGVWKEYISIFKNNLDLYPITKEKYDENQIVE